MRKRLDYELSVIEMKGFAPYFLIVSDYIQWARRNGIVTTTRGSAAGSLVSFAIGISTVDPLRYQLPFERFLNPERPSAPDVDGDFADNRRDEMLRYVSEKYGADKVAQICTFGTMMARGSVRDVGRALGSPYGYVDEIAKLVPMGSQGFPMTLTRALEETEDLKKRYDGDPQVRRLIDLAKRIEGCARHVSIHAAGVVIAPTPLTDFTPLQVETREGKVITQYEMKSVEAAGLLKMDFLGIRNLSILGDAVKLVKKTKGVEIILERIPVDDQKTFDLLAAGYTMGTFQLNGDGMTKYLMELKPTRIEDIMAMVALYRPGPIDSIPEYIRRKHDPSLVAYADPRLCEILERSYGVLVYQDDVMLIAIKLAGYSWLEADKLRKAMGKKIPEEMAKQKEKLISGFTDHGLSQAKAQDLWKLIEPFAAYGFNKAHAASYGMVAYFTAYLKANFPAEYMTALMTAESGDLETIGDAVKECERMEIRVLPPDLNESEAMFTYVDDQTIRFGLFVIKNLGEEVVDAIIAERRTHGPYQDLADFAERLHHRAFNKKSLEALAKVGALDRFAERRQILENIDRILFFNRESGQSRAQNQGSLFDLAPSMAVEKLRLHPVPPAPRSELLAWERELLGLYVSEHPFRPIAEKFGTLLTPCSQVAQQADRCLVRAGGIVTSIKEITTKKGERMAFVGLEDGKGTVEVVVFPSVFQSCAAALALDALVLVGATVSRRPEEETKLLANFITKIEEDRLEETIAWLKEEKQNRGLDVKQETTPPPSLCIVLGTVSPETLENLRTLFQSSSGTHQVQFLIRSAGAERRVQTDYFVAPSPELLKEIAGMVGRQNVSLFP